jgi:hypothetical protein
MFLCLWNTRLNVAFSVEVVQKPELFQQPSPAFGQQVSPVGQLLE